MRVLIFNFFAGVMDRGIPLYARDIAESMRRVEIEAVELRCPKLLRRSPRWIINIAFVIFEQLVAPVVRVMHRCSITVYPYNSCGLVDTALGRSVLVVHDLIANRSTNVAARYICVTQAAHRRLGRPVCAASEHTLTLLRRLRTFKRCPLELWSNPFYSFEAALASYTGDTGRPKRRRPRVLLCSGSGRNKDYGGAVKLFLHSRALRGAELRVLGFGDHHALARRWFRYLPESARARVTILPRLTLRELVEEYVDSDLVWVHSGREGFGRCIVEGRLSGRPVIASDIVAFRKLGVELYSKDTFDGAVVRTLKRGTATRSKLPSCHAQLETAVSRVCRGLLASPGPRNLRSSDGVPAAEEAAEGR